VIRLMKPTKIVLDLLTRAAMYNIVGERRLICQFNGGDREHTLGQSLIILPIL